MQYLSTSKVVKPLRFNGSEIKALITACGAEPVPIVCLPTTLVLMIGLTPSFALTSTAKEPKTSSNSGIPFLR